MEQYNTPNVASEEDDIYETMMMTAAALLMQVFVYCCVTRLSKYIFGAQRWQWDDNTSNGDDGKRDGNGGSKEDSPRAGFGVLLC